MSSPSIDTKNVLLVHVVIGSMIEIISFRIFLFCLFSTAGLMIYQMWNVGSDGPVGPPLLIQVAFTLFVIGLTAFLVWFSAFAYWIKQDLQNR